jgi:ATP/maltotriose-dependent transcriptional regulator MalT
VKKHAESIYRKLHVNNRRDAISRAQALGIL